mmetsp:Transcript_7566/g.13372  ORF Transcript_7566/g.13372 Transcript_7566/m.13372 type:complete len:221 (+) Transcript_7566:395-1057(+)
MGLCWGTLFGAACSFSWWGYWGAWCSVTAGYWTEFRSECEYPEVSGISWDGGGAWASTPSGTGTSWAGPGPMAQASEYSPGSGYGWSGGGAGPACAGRGGDVTWKRKLSSWLPACMGWDGSRGPVGERGILGSGLEVSCMRMSTTLGPLSSSPSSTALSSARAPPAARRGRRSGTDADGGIYFFLGPVGERAASRASALEGSVVAARSVSSWSECRHQSP